MVEKIKIDIHIHVLQLHANSQQCYFSTSSYALFTDNPQVKY